VSTLNSLDFIILALATYRISRLITQDHIFAGLRDSFWKRFPPETTKIGYFSTCMWCTSIWVGLGFIIWYTISADVSRIFAVVFALSAIAGLLTAYEDKD